MKSNISKICVRIVIFILIVLLINSIFHWYSRIHVCSSVFGIETSFKNIISCDYHFIRLVDKYFFSISSSNERNAIANNLIAFSKRIAIVKNILILIVFIIFVYITLPLTNLIKDNQR